MAYNYRNCYLLYPSSLQWKNSFMFPCYSHTFQRQTSNFRLISSWITLRFRITCASGIWDSSQNSFCIANVGDENLYIDEEKSSMPNQQEYLQKHISKEKNLDKLKILPYCQESIHKQPLLHLAIHLKHTHLHLLIIVEVLNYTAYRVFFSFLNSKQRSCH